MLIVKSSGSIEGGKNEDDEKDILSYSEKLFGMYNGDIDVQPTEVISKEHAYSKPWNWCLEKSFAKPTKTLFFSKPVKNETNGTSCDEEIDVVNGCDDVKSNYGYDLDKAYAVMREIENHCNFTRPTDNDDEWEEHIPKVGWTYIQYRLFSRVLPILNFDLNARLAYTGSKNEPVLRRLSVDKTARKFRELLCSTQWDLRLIQWLHGVLIDYLPSFYLAVYIDILQTLRRKIPQLIDRMMNTAGASGRFGPTSVEGLSNLLKRTWDPVAPSLPAFKPRKLPGDALLVMVPSSPGDWLAPHSRAQQWMTSLSDLSTVITVMTTPNPQQESVNMMSCLDHMLAATRSKLSELRTDYPGRPIILVGLHTGAALALQVALFENVAATVCLGFPVNTVEGRRGTPDDAILDLKSPVFFVSGALSVTASPEEMEELRWNLRTPTGLLIVGGADDHLCVSDSLCVSEGITQSMVDRCILDEIGEFLGNTLVSPHTVPPFRPPPTRTSSITNDSPVLRRSLKSERKQKIIDTNFEPKKTSPVPPKKPRLLPPKLTPMQLSQLLESSRQSSTTMVNKKITAKVLSDPDIEILFQEGNENSNSSNSVSPGSNTTTSITPQATLSLSDSISRSRMNLMTVHRAPAVTKHTDPITGATSSITHRTVLKTGRLTPISSFIPTKNGPTRVMLPSRVSHSNEVTSEVVSPTKTVTLLENNVLEDLTPDKILDLPIEIACDDSPIEVTPVSTQVPLSVDKSGMKLVVRKPQHPLPPRPPNLKYSKIFVTHKSVDKGKTLKTNHTPINR
nr:PREDICTED: KAT8 regulatory NSL complex subunit 3 [Bemisia tabaci]